MGRLNEAAPASDTLLRWASERGLNFGKIGALAAFGIVVFLPVITSGRGVFRIMRRLLSMRRMKMQDI